MFIHRTTVEGVKALDESTHFKGEIKDLLELEEGDLVITMEERKQLAEELSTHYVSYNKPELRELVKKICRIIP